MSFIIYIIGKPGVGKYTIAKELASVKKEFIICDNHLINNVIFELFQPDFKFKLPEFVWDSIGKIRSEVFRFLEKMKDKSYILTNCLFENDEYDQKLYREVENMALNKGSIFVPIILNVQKDEHLKRIVNEERKLRFKAVKPEDINCSTQLLNVSHKNLLNFDTTNLSSSDACRKILTHLKNLHL